MCQCRNRKRIMNDDSHGKISLAFKFPFILIIRIYRFFSPVKQFLLGPHARCRFYPTCSEYALECFRFLPISKAFVNSFARIGKCNPLHPGGYDPVFPDQKDPN